MLGMGVGRFKVSLVLEGGTEVLDMPAVRALAVVIPEESYAQAIALACGEHWRSDPDHGQVYALIFQYPKAVTAPATVATETEGGG
jgi:hypothetical protein